MSLLTYDQARPWAKSIAKVTHDRTMPPWFANPEHGEFVEDPRLTRPADRDPRIVGCRRACRRATSRRRRSRRPSPPSGGSAEPDATFTAEPFQVGDEVEDHYQWLKVENPIAEERWIKAIEVRPGFPEVVHHQLTYLGPPGATIESLKGAGQLDLTFVGGWGPGVAPLVFPDGYGMRMPANSTMFFQMHYHKAAGPGTGGTDQTKIGLKFYEQPPENVMETLWLVDPALNIPPGEANYRSTSWVDFEHEAILFDFTPHMHLRGKSMVFRADYPSGEKEVLLDVPGYDFDWQLSYTPTQPKILPPGTRLGVEAVFDNSAANVDNPDPAAWVRFGEKTTDEMMVGFVHYTFVDKSKQVDMPSFVVPEALKEQVEKMREMRKQQREGAGAAAPTSGAAAFEGKNGS